MQGEGAGGPNPAGADAGHMEACNARILPLAAYQKSTWIVRIAIDSLFFVHFTGVGKKGPATVACGIQ